MDRGYVAHVRSVGCDRMSSVPMLGSSSLVRCWLTIDGCKREASSSPAHLTISHSIHLYLFVNTTFLRPSPARAKFMNRYEPTHTEALVLVRFYRLSTRRIGWFFLITRQPKVHQLRSAWSCNPKLQSKSSGMASLKWLSSSRATNVEGWCGCYRRNMARESSALISRMPPLLPKHRHRKITATYMPYL